MAWDGEFATTERGLDLGSLHPGERAVIDAARGWQTCERSGGLAMARFAVAGAGLPVEVMPPLAAALGVLGAFALSGRPRTNMIADAELGRDEAVLLDTLAALQVGADRDAILLVRAWFASPLARGITLASLQDLADALRACGCLLPGGRLRALAMLDESVAA